MDAFAALADPVRRDLVSRLARGTARVVDLAGEHAISRPAISRHLRVLGEAGLVTADDVGRERHYRLARGGLSPVTDYLATLVPAPRFDETALDGLDLEVRRTVRDHATPHSDRNRTTTEESA
ncbi:ArsR/SmtB family transcription factor [Occultella kanbiaonis]|uniref:ArsR/SmtB family transcription factor n=1 Tax=Occultella kanbiaonis TaxID=2675754 RepID=UPI0012B7A6A3|nr:metalloregulator ArsR/SmtB family transcription factor [Occultella kanbiaonis]